MLTPPPTFFRKKTLSVLDDSQNQSVEFKKGGNEPKGWKIFSPVINLISSSLFDVCFCHIITVQIGVCKVVYIISYVIP